MRERLERLDEACQIIKSLFQETKTSFQGRFYQLNDASLEPKPVQRPLPLLIGGGGEKRTLLITAKYADEWNVWGEPALLRQKMDILDAHCADVGRDPSQIQRSAVALLFMNEDKAFIENIRKTTMQQARIIGSVDEVKEIVAQYEAAGVNELIIPDFTLGKMDQKIATLFITQVAGR